MSDRQRRYARHTVLSQIGEAGQAKLAASSALVVGAGGLGSNALAALAAGGLGRIGVADHDRVELSNLPRQLLFEEADIGRYKADSAADRLKEMNGECRVEPLRRRLEPHNARELISSYDIVLDGSDNFATRFAVAQACAKERKPLVSGAMAGFSAQLSTFKPYLGAPHPCYRCLVPEAPARQRTCAMEGVVSPLGPALGAMQALEAMKELLGIGRSLSGRLLVYEALEASWREIALPRDPACPHCGKS